MIVLKKTIKTKREKRIQQLMALIAIAVVSLILNVVFLVGGTINYVRANHLEESLETLQNAYDSDTTVLESYISQLTYEKSLLINNNEVINPDGKDATTLTRDTESVVYDSGKIAYLTFDDGPSALTSEILDVLDHYGVKATFFIKGVAIKYYPDTLAREANEGHTIGNHTVTHNYATIYESLDALESEIKENNRRIKEITGITPTAFRFPGGSSNSMFATYAPDVELDEFLNLIHEMGMEYYDWNVSSLDASSNTKTPDELFNAVVKGCTGVDQVTILMHDAGNKQSTLEALPRIIEWLLEQGYSIEPITDSTYPIQHRKVSED